MPPPKKLETQIPPLMPPYPDKRPQQSRQSRRYQRRIPVQAINGKAVDDSFLLDISSLGFKVESTVPLTLNDPVQVTFTMPDTGKTVTYTGQVMWTRTTAPLGSRYLLGVKMYIPQWEIDLLARRWEGLSPMK